MTRECRNICPDGMFADPLSRECVQQCLNGTDYYGDGALAIPKCVQLCSAGTFSNSFTL